MELIYSLIKWFKTLDLSVQQQKSLRFARRLYFLWIFVNYTILAFSAEFFYSKASLIPKRSFQDLTWLMKLFSLLESTDLNFLYPLFIGLILVFSLAGIYGKRQRLVSFMCYILMMNLDNKAYAILDGGNNLVHLIGFYLIFIDTDSTKSRISILSTNLASLMIKIQICFVYATAGLLKVMGPLWNKGVALYYTMGVAEFGNETIFNLLSGAPIILALLSLGTVLFQISFPYLIWNRALRPYIILIGTSLHLSISFVMGLFMFGFAMFMSYFFFKTDNETFSAKVT